MNSKKKTKRYEDAGVRRIRLFAGGGLPEAITGGAAAYVAGDESVAGGAANPGIDLAELLDGLFDSVSLDQLPGDGTTPESLDDFKCIAPNEQATVFDFFRGLNAADEEMAVSHVEHCHYCKEAVGVMGTLMKAAGKGNEFPRKEFLHPRSGGLEEAEADQEVIWD
jgi:hypothetical protein